MAERLPSLQELQEACIDDLPRLLLRKVLEVATAASSSSLATQKAAAAKLLGQLDPHMVATAVQLYSVFHQKDSAKTAGLVSILQNIDDDTHHRFRDAFLETVADTSLLERLKMIPPGGDVFPKKLRIVNTNVYARQHKFNLLVEESEGYSKFLYGAQQQMDDHIDTVMGTFSLDPNRCLDLLLNLLIHALRQASAANAIEYLTRSIRRLDTGKLPHLVGFMSRRITPFEDNGTTNTEDVVLVATHLIQHDIVQLEELLPYLNDDSVDWQAVVERVYDDYVQKQTIRIKKINLISLASPAATEPLTQELLASSSSSSLEVIRFPLERLLVMKFIIRLQRDAYPKLSTAADWSKLATLFPETIGVWLLDYCANILCQCFTDPSMAAAAAADVGTTTLSRPVLLETAVESELLQRLDVPLRAIRDAGVLHYRPEFFIRLCRSIQRPALWKDLLKTVLLPSSSAFPANPSIHLELWRVLEQFGYEDRYAMYEFWKEDADQAVWMKEVEALVLKDVRYSLRRLSKDTVRDLSRAVAKCCFRNPIIVFTTILSQIESYDNLVGVMVDVCRFVSPLGLDVLGFCILQRLTAARRNRLKESGVHASQWLQSLESFTGSFCKRYPHVEFQGLVSYLRRRLEDGQVIELGMLQVLLTTAGGFKFRDYSPISGLTVAQLQGRAGSTVLQRETMSFGVVEGIEWKSAKQVRKALQKDGTALLILLAQVQYQIIFEGGDDMPVKLIGNLVDKCRVVMAILLDFLTNNRVDDKAIEQYAKALPSFEDLVREYEVDGAVVWQLYRPVFREALSGEADGLQSFIPTEKSRAFFKTMLPSDAWSHITVDLFEFFSMTSLYDIHCPTDAYTTEMKRLEREIERASQKKGPQAGDEATIEHSKKVVSDLEADLAKQQTHVEDTIGSFKKRRDTFMVEVHVSREAALRFFVNLIYPRCLQGPDDALYCAYFISELHRNETKGFGTLFVYDCIIVTMSRALFGLTEEEAACASILLFEVWKVISSCRFDEKEFENVFAGKTGAVMTDDQVPISYEAYKRVYDKWHNEIAAACVGCLVSSEYIHLRNCLVVLSRMVDIYPTHPRIAKKLLQKLEPLQEESNGMADIRAAARAYNMQMLQARDEGAWKEEDDAMVKARLAEVEAAAAERQKKAKQTMAQIKADSEKITETIGEWSSRDRSRGRHDMDDRRPDARRRQQDDRRQEDRRTVPMRPTPQAGGGQPAERWPRDRPLQGVPRDRDVTAPPPRIREEDASRNHNEVRPPRSGVGGGGRSAADTLPSPSRGHNEGRKRSRPSSPVDQGEARDEARAASSNKRPRNETEEKKSTAEADGGGSGRRRIRNDRRGRRS
jgi:Transcription factor/nuclear export subunit protein 2/Transcription- and export-related complex subunit/THO complex subunit 2 N-terminus